MHSAHSFQLKKTNPEVSLEKYWKTVPAHHFSPILKRKSALYRIKSKVQGAIGLHMSKVITCLKYALPFAGIFLFFRFIRSFGI